MNRRLTAAALSLTLLTAACGSGEPRRSALPLPTGGVATTPGNWSRLNQFEVLTQYSPASTFVGQAIDLTRLSRAFTGILLASGKLGASREQAVALSSSLGLHVWLDVDLTADYAVGTPIRPRLEALAAFAQRHRDVVVGFKLANELGQDDPYAHDPRLVEGYLREVGTVLHDGSPGLPLTVDLPIPEAACADGSPGLDQLGGGAACRQRVEDQFPALSQARVDHYLSMGVLDGVFVSPYLRADEVYTAAGTDTAEVLAHAYAWILDRPWAGRVKVFSRKALAFPDASYPGSGPDAEQARRRHLEVPLRAGLMGTDIWAWHRPFRGELRTLMDKDGSSNALWEALTSFRAGLTTRRTTPARTPLPPAGSGETASPAAVAGGSLPCGATRATGARFRCG